MFVRGETELKTEDLLMAFWATSELFAGLEAVSNPWFGNDVTW
jgi:hypothetical protein